uniref:Uncharacterized protein n=1 Tax=Anser brachyrhynchus TaxID=132585 RepID=A0A8B9BQY3_9AVES
GAEPQRAPLPGPRGGFPEELTSTSVEHLIINPNAAFEKFKDKRLGTEGVDFSDRISKMRTTGYEAGEYEMVSPELTGTSPQRELVPRDVPARGHGSAQGSGSAHSPKSHSRINVRWVEVGRDPSVLVVRPPVQLGPSRAGCPGPRPGGF